MENVSYLVTNEQIDPLMYFDTLEEAQFYCKFTPACDWFIYERTSYGFNESGALGADVPRKGKSRWQLIEKVDLPHRVIRTDFGGGRNGEE